MERPQINTGRQGVNTESGSNPLRIKSGSNSFPINNNYHKNPTIQPDSSFFRQDINIDKW